MNNTTNQYIVCWRYNDGSQKGHGSPISKIVAQAAASVGNAKHPKIHHWIERIN